MMRFPHFAQARIVVGGNGVNHVVIYLILIFEDMCKCQALLDYGADMVDAVGLVEGCITGDDFILYIFLQFRIHTKRPSRMVRERSQSPARAES